MEAEREGVATKSLDDTTNTLQQCATPVQTPMPAGKLVSSHSVLHSDIRISSQEEHMGHLFIVGVPSG